MEINNKNWVKNNSSCNSIEFIRAKLTLCRLNRFVSCYSVWPRLLPQPMATPITTMTVTTRAIMNHFTGANLNIITWQSQRVAWDITTRNIAVPTRPTIIRFLLITAFFHIILAAIVTVTPTATSPTRIPSQLINLVNKQPNNALWPSF